jgi:ATP-binding cassette, subfamily B, bacterial MsbA
MSYKQFISRLSFYLKIYTGKLIFTSLMMMIAAVLASLIPEIVGQIVDKLFMDGESESDIWFYTWALPGAIAASSLFTFLAITAGSWVAGKVAMDLRSDIFAKLLKLPKSYFDQNTTGSILSRVTYDVEQLSSVSSIWVDFVKNSMFVIILAGYLFYKSWELSLSLIVVLPLIVITVKSSSSRLRKSSKRAQQSMSGMIHLLDENISGASLIKIYHAQKQECKKFFNLSQDMRQQRFKINMASAYNMANVNILIAIPLSASVYFSSVYLQMSSGEFLSYFTALGMLSKPSKSLVNANKHFQKALISGKSIFRMMDEEEEKNNGRKHLKKVEGYIKFKNVSFSYVKQQAVLNNIDLEIKVGETIALVGSTGSGKTTIIQLLAKLYLVDSGSITINNIDISEFELNSLRSQIAFVDQNVRLFDDTVKGNIALGQANNMSSEKVEYAAKIANAYDFIQGLSEQFDSEIGENGVKLSGGQRQRLAIARAVAKDSPILLLDEATSALDSITEKQVQLAIEGMQKNRTTIIVAHRLSTIQKADKIIVMHLGQIVEQGTHQELLDLNGKYASLYGY